MNSTHDEIPDGGHGGAVRAVPARRVGLATVAPGLVGALVALVLGLLTFGVQATVEPRHVPLAVGTADAAAATALAPVAERVAAQGGEAVDWRTVSSRAEAERLLDRKEIYGAVLFSPGPTGPSATVLVSGALNPSATQVAQPLLTQVAEGVVAAARAQAASGSVQPGAAATPPSVPAPGAGSPAVQVVTLHPTSAAGRTLPLAAGALLWLATLVASALVTELAPRLLGGEPLGGAWRIASAVLGALLATGVVVGLARFWDAGLPLGWSAAGFLALVGVAFAFLQTGVLRWLGLRGLALLAPLYLMAPAVAGLVPELLNPVYRVGLWSWTPFRFSTEGLRSLLFLGPDAPDVQTALLVFGGIAVAGLALVALPKPSDRPATSR